MKNTIREGSLSQKVKLFIDNQTLISKKNNGYIAILTVILISAVVLAISTTVSLLAIGEAQSSFAVFNGENTISFVDGCMEDALVKSRNSSTYTGGTIIRPEGTCTITVSKVGTTWTITATTTATTYVRTIKSVITRGNIITITSWQEI